MKAVLFDLDDTLYPESQFVTSGFEGVAEFLSCRFGLDRNHAFHQMLALLEKYGRGKVFDRLLDDLGLGSPARVMALVQVYRSHEPTLRLFPEVPQLLGELRRMNLMLGIITDGMASVQMSKIRALGLKRLVDVVICTDELGRAHWKPSTTPYQVALERLAFLAHECVYVGDNPEKDFAGANRLGMTTVRVLRDSIDQPARPPSRLYRPDLTISRLEELPGLIRRRHCA